LSAKGGEGPSTWRSSFSVLKEKKEERKGWASSLKKNNNDLLLLPISFREESPYPDSLRYSLLLFRSEGRKLDFPPPYLQIIEKRKGEEMAVTLSSRSLPFITFSVKEKGKRKESLVGKDI